MSGSVIKTFTDKRLLASNPVTRLLANRRLSAKVLMTEPDIAQAVKEILGLLFHFSLAIALG